MKRLPVLLIIIFFIFVFISLWWSHGTQAVNKNDATQRIFVVEKGTGVREIASKLKQENLIKDPTVFFLLVKQNGLDGKIQAGDFRLSSSMTALEIAKALTHGTLDIWITIPEGKRATEIGQILKEKMPNYMPIWNDELIKYEGYLFPDTYLFSRDANIQTIIKTMTGTFENKFAQIPNPHNMKKSDIVTIASLIERETKPVQDRPIVASVIENRLSLGMPLQLDATVQYIVGTQKCKLSTFNSQLSTSCNWWPHNFTSNDLAIPSLYNTYITVGLPPTPIANPGFESLKAAANPAQTDYLYYISDPKGAYHYAKTFEGHNANITKYGLEN